MAGTITQTLIKNFPLDSNIQVLKFDCTADASDGSFPATVTENSITVAIKGWWIIEVRTNPGTPAPQENYDIALNDVEGIDLMGGSLANRHQSNSEAAPPSIMPGVYWPRPINGALTVVITNNNVNSAKLTIQVFLGR